MDDFEVKNHDFENAKLAIKRFSEETTTDLDLSRVHDKKKVSEWLGDAFLGGGIGLNHKVTGEELNELTTQIQKHLHSVNSTQIKLIREFGQVYSALESLDKDYIQGILISIKATEKTSERIEATQTEIKQIVDDQKKTLEILKKFKQKLDNYAHLGDIYAIWDDFRKWNDEASSLTAAVSDAVTVSGKNRIELEAVQSTQDGIQTEVARLSEKLSEQIVHTEEVISFISDMKKIVHMGEIDSMWNSLSIAHSNLQDISNELNAVKNDISEQQESINSLLEFTASLSQYEHIRDVDVIWLKAEVTEQKISNLGKHEQAIIEELHNSQKMIAELDKHNAEVSAVIQINKESTAQSLAELNGKTDSLVQQLNKKIQYAYWVAGGAATLALLELAALLLR